jgi:hypothetical protein
MPRAKAVWVSTLVPEMAVIIVVVVVIMVKGLRK